MSGAVTSANVLLGLAYVAMGTIALYELVAWRDHGFSRFGAGLVAIAFTCGPHHLTHAVHVGLENHPASALDLLTVLVGLPPGLTWLALRVEALAGGRGDRFIAGTPGWMAGVPTLAGAYVAAIVAVAVAIGAAPRVSPVVLLGLGTAAVYGAIAWVMARTQVRNRLAVGGWSLSGCTIAGTFATCAAMHLALALGQVRGTAHADVHLVVIDAAAMVAGVYLLAVVRRLTHDLLDDWNTVALSEPALS